jgi:hypothetical protein
MNAIPCLALAALASGLAAPAVRAAADPAASDVASKFNLITDDYRKPAVLAESIFNPFKVQVATLPGGGHKDAGSITNDSLADAVGRHHVTGLLLAADAAGNRVIIGDQVFSIGDPVEFDEPGKEAPAPLVAGAVVVLRAVKKDSLSFDVGLEGENAHRVDLPLRDFWRP